MIETLLSLFFFGMGTTIGGLCFMFCFYHATFMSTFLTVGYDIRDSPSESVILYNIFVHPIIIMLTAYASGFFFRISGIIHSVFNL